MTSARDTRTTLQTARTWSIVVLLLLGIVAMPAETSTRASAFGTEPSFDVHLNENGSAHVFVTMTYDLSDADERAAFESLTNDSDARQNATETFADRLRSVAANASEATGREMRILDVQLWSTPTDDGTVGVLRYDVHWDGLAAVEGDELRVTEPFASGFTPERPFTLAGPPGYELTDVTSSASETGTSSATWEAGTSLEGFSATFEPSRGGESRSIPGFGLGATLVAVSAILVLLARRRDVN